LPPALPNLPAQPFSSFPFCSSAQVGHLIGAFAHVGVFSS
jgi:hypothetical protein